MPSPRESTRNDAIPRYFGRDLDTVFAGRSSGWEPDGRFYQFGRVCPRVLVRDRIIVLKLVDQNRNMSPEVPGNFASTLHISDNGDQEFNEHGRQLRILSVAWRGSPGFPSSSVYQPRFATHSGVDL